MYAVRSGDPAVGGGLNPAALAAAVASVSRQQQQQGQQQSQQSSVRCVPLLFCFATFHLPSIHFPFYIMFFYLFFLSSSTFLTIFLSSILSSGLPFFVTLLSYVCVAFCPLFSRSFFLSLRPFLPSSFHPRLLYFIFLYIGPLFLSFLLYTFAAFFLFPSVLSLSLFSSPILTFILFRNSRCLTAI